MTPAVWQDMAIRLRNLRGDMIVQWQGDIDNPALEQAVGALGSAIQMWRLARPSGQAPAPLAEQPSDVVQSP